MTDNTTIAYFKPKANDTALAKVRLSSNFCEQTHRPWGTTGLLRRFDAQNTDVAVIDIGEKLPVRVHIMDFTYIG